MLSCFLSLIDKKCDNFYIFRLFIGLELHLIRSIRFCLAITTYWKFSASSYLLKLYWNHGRAMFGIHTHSAGHPLDLLVSFREGCWDKASLVTGIMMIATCPLVIRSPFKKILPSCCSKSKRTTCILKLTDMILFTSETAG